MVKIISDSTCDLSQALIEKYDITILPLHILLGDKEYRDGADITPEEIFAWSEQDNSEDVSTISRGGGRMFEVIRGGKDGSDLLLNFCKYVDIW